MWIFPVKFFCIKVESYPGQNFRNSFDMLEKKIHMEEATKDMFHEVFLKRLDWMKIVVEANNLFRTITRKNRYFVLYFISNFCDSRVGNFVLFILAPSAIQYGCLMVKTGFLLHAVVNHWVFYTCYTIKMCSISHFVYSLWPV